MKQIFKQNHALGLRAALFLSIALVLMMLDQTNEKFHQARSNLSLVVSPIQYFVSLPINFIDWIVTDIVSQQTLLQENARLRSQLTFLKAELQKQNALATENKQLHALLKSSKPAEGKVLAASLLGISSDPFVRQVVINKGRFHHVYVGQPVIDAYGIMGQIISVAPFTSRLMLLKDSQSAIPVQINRNGIRAMAVGDNRLNLLKLKHVTVTTDIQPGDILMTSGLGQRYPYGYPVGTVISVLHNPGDQFADITVSPSAHINRSRLVLLFWDKKNPKNTTKTQVKTK